MIDLKIQYPGIKFHFEYKYGADESSGYKNMNFKKRKSDQPIQIQLNDEGQPIQIPFDESMPLPPALKKPRKETKSLFASQVAPTRLVAILPDGTVEELYVNENSNSIFGHVSNRHCYERENAGL